MANPIYKTRAGFITPTWTEVFSTYSRVGNGWDRIAGNFTWDELAAGPVPDIDVKTIRADRSASTLLTRMRVGQGNYTFDNFNGDYSPILNPLVRPSQPITTKAISDVGSVYNIFSGTVTDIVVNPVLEKRTTNILVEDIAEKLRRTASTALGIETKTSSLVTEVLDDVGIPSALQRVDAISDDIPFGYLDNITGGEALDQLVKSGNHFSYINGRGQIVFKGRDSVNEGTQQTVNTFWGINITNTNDSLFNDVRVSGILRENTSVATLSYITEAIAIASGQAISFFTEYLDPETKEVTPANSVETPVSSADYRFTENSDGSGFDLISSITVSFRAFANTSFVEITSTNTAGFLSKFQVQGTPLQLQPPFLARSESSSSQSIYERQVFGLESNLLNGFSFAKDYADFIKETHQDPKQEINFSLKNEFPTILTRDLGDVIQLEEDNSGIDDPVRIDRLVHIINPSARGLEHIVEYHAQNNVGSNFDIMRLDQDPEGRLDDIYTLGF